MNKEQIEKDFKDWWRSSGYLENAPGAWRSMLDAWFSAAKKYNQCDCSEKAISMLEKHVDMICKQKKQIK